MNIADDPYISIDEQFRSFAQYSRVTEQLNLFFFQFIQRILRLRTHEYLTKYLIPIVSMNTTVW